MTPFDSFTLIYLSLDLPPMPALVAELGREKYWGKLDPADNDIAEILRRMQPRSQRYDIVATHRALSNRNTAPICRASRHGAPAYSPVRPRSA